MEYRKLLLSLTLLGLGGCTSPPTPVAPTAVEKQAPAARPLAPPMAPDSQCGGFEALELGEPMPVLNGQLTVRMPQGAEDRARSPDIMSAPNAASTETRLVVDIGEARLVVITHAFLATEAANLDASELLRSDAHVDYGAVEENAGFKRLVGTYRVLAPDDDTVVVATALTKLPDGTLQETLFAVNEVAFKLGVGGCKAMAKRVFATLQRGPTPLDLSERDVSLEAGEYSLHVPAGYIYYPQPGPDFTVYRMQKLVALGQRAATAGIYFGYHASFHPDGTETKQPGRVLGQGITWYEVSLSGGILRDTLIPQGGHGQIHLFLGAPNQADADVLTKALSSLKKTTK